MRATSCKEDSWAHQCTFGVTSIVTAAAAYLDIVRWHGPLPSYSLAEHLAPVPLVAG